MNAGICLIDYVYELEPLLITGKKAAAVDEKTMKFAEEQVSASVAFLSGLYIYAWEKSASVKLPEWSPH
jgi:hypothetical protein